MWDKGICNADAQLEDTEEIEYIRQIQLDAWKQGMNDAKQCIRLEPVQDFNTCCIEIDKAIREKAICETN